jgi:hypothetical protein
MSRCCGMQRCRLSDAGSITWSRDGGDISIDIVGPTTTVGSHLIVRESLAGCNLETN